MKVIGFRKSEFKGDDGNVVKTKEELEEMMVQKAELFLDEGYVFGEEGAGFERVNLAVPRWVLEEALERLEKAVLG